MKVQGDLVDVRAKKLVSGDIGTRIVLDLSPDADMGSLRALMLKTLVININEENQKGPFEQ
jgi:hypothetical protein